MAVSFANMNLERRSRQAPVAPPPYQLPPPPSRPHPSSYQQIPRAEPIDYYATLPPLADHPLLELRRPQNKDACFVVSALSPALPARYSSEQNTASSSLLDRFLSQQSSFLAPPGHPQSGPQPYIPTPVLQSSTPGGLWGQQHTPLTPGNPRNEWSFMTQLPGPPPRNDGGGHSRVQSIEEEPQLTSNSQHTRTSSHSTSTFRQQARGPAPRPLTDRVIIPQSPPPQYRPTSPPNPPSLRSEPVHSSRYYLPNNESAPSSRRTTQDSGSSAFAKQARPSSPQESITSRSSRKTEKLRQEATLERLTRPPSPRRKGDKSRKDSNATTSSSASESSRSSRRSRQPSQESSSSSRGKVCANMPPSALQRVSTMSTSSTRSAPIRSRKPPPLPIDIQKARDEAAALLEGRATPAPMSNSSMPLSGNSITPRGKPLSPASTASSRGVPLKPLNTRMNPSVPRVHVSMVISPVSDPMSPLSFGSSPIAFRPALADSIWSPKTPVAMSYELPLIIDDFPESLQGVAWAPDDRGTVIEMDAQLETPVELAAPRGRDFARSLLPQPRRVPEERSRTSDRDHRNRSRARSESPPRSAYPDDSAFQYTLPPLRSGRNSPRDEDDEQTPMEDSRQKYYPQAANPRQKILSSYFMGLQ